MYRLGLALCCVSILAGIATLTYVGRGWYEATAPAIAASPDPLQHGPGVIAIEPIALLSDGQRELAELVSVMAAVEARLAESRRPAPPPLARPLVDTSVVVAGPPTAPAAPSLPLPAVPRLANLGVYRYEPQTLNNCGPVTAMMVLSLFGHSLTQAQTAAVLKPGATDKSVTIDEVAAYVRSFGLQAPIRRGGSTDTMKRLVAAGVPVIVHQQLAVGDDIGHYRLVVGFDDGAGLMITGDSYLGRVHRMGYAEFERVWEAYNHAYMPVFLPAKQAEVQAILGTNWDQRANWQQVRDRAGRDVAANPDNALAWWRLGEAEHHTAEPARAWLSFQQAIRLGMAPKTFWYQFTPFETLVALGDWQGLERLADTALRGLAGNPEVLVYKGRALAEQGQQERAIGLYRQALVIDPQNPLARAALGQ